MSSKNNEENGYGLDLDLLTVLHKLCDSYHTRSGCGEESAHLRHVYLEPNEDHEALDLTTVSLVNLFDHETYINTYFNAICISCSHTQMSSK